MSARAAPTPVVAPAVDALRGMDPLLLLLRASLIALLVNSNDDTLVLVAVAASCVLALPRPAVLTSPWFWGAAFAVIGARQLSSWHDLDDHVIVTTYWCGAIALALTAKDQRTTLAASARFLVGALFAFAAGWKLRSAEFADGSFFRHAFLFDERFEVAARLVGGTSDAAHDANFEAVEGLLAGSGTGEVMLREGARNTALAQLFTWWGLLIESTVAVAFLLPLRQRYQPLRHAALIGFAATTYVVVPVGGFGTLLLVLGAAQATSERGRIGYLIGGLGLLVWTRIWPLVFL